MKTSESLKKAVKKYDAKTYDKCLLRLPKGYKELIQKTGNTYNGYIKEAVLKQMKIDKLI